MRDRDTHTGTSELRAAAREALDAGTRWIEAARHWLLDKRDEMNPRDDERDTDDLHRQDHTAAHVWTRRHEGGRSASAEGQRSASGYRSMREREDQVVGLGGTHGDRDYESGRASGQRRSGEEHHWRSDRGFGEGYGTAHVEDSDHYERHMHMPYDAAGWDYTRQRDLERSAKRHPQDDMPISERDHREREHARTGTGHSYGQSYQGRGPRNYTRSDARIAEDLNERLADSEAIDASDIVVEVAQGVVTLSGTVERRWMKHLAEDLADRCSGVKDVHNHIRVIPMASESGLGSGASNMPQDDTDTAAGDSARTTGKQDAGSVDSPASRRER